MERKKEKLFERSEFFSFSGRVRFLDFSCQRRHLLFTFLCCWRKVKARRLKTKKIVEIEIYTLTGQ